MKRKIFFLTFTLFIFVFLFMFSSPSISKEKPIMWKFANYGSATSPWNMLPAWFFRELEDRSGGRIKTKLYLASSLVPMKQAPEALKGGVCESTVFVPPYYHSKIPLSGFLSYPFVLPGSGSKDGIRDTFLIADKYLSHPNITKELEKWDAMYIAPHGFTQYEMIGNKPVRNLNDLKGLRVRVTGPHVSVMKEFGAVPVWVSTSEAYEALQKGTLDIFAHSVYFFHRYKIFEVCKYLIDDMQMGTTMDPFVIKLSAFKALPKDLQDVILQLKKEALVKFWSTYYEEEALGRQVLADSGLEVIHFPKSDRAKMKKVAKKITWPEWIKKTKKLGLPAEAMSEWILDEIKKMGW